MNDKQKYTAPAVIDDLALELEGEILKTSVVSEDTEVVSTGQEYEQIDLKDFAHQWE